MMGHYYKKALVDFYWIMRDDKVEHMMKNLLTMKMKLPNSKVKEEALRNKAIMEGLIREDDDVEREELFEVHELPVCNIRRFMMIKYSFGQDEEYVAVKEDEYNDLTRTSEDAYRAYQEIFRMMDEGWMVARANGGDVDDMLIMGINMDVINQTKKLLHSSFDMKDMGEADVILGIRIQKNFDGYILTQSHYIEKTLKKFGHYDDRPVVTPLDPKVQLKKNKGQSVSQYWMAIGFLTIMKASPQVDVFTLGGAVVSWKSSKQTVNTRSTMETKFVALDKAAKKAEWLRAFLG
ncbi:retrotransposon protein, putative, ty1-copia subclass [Tanacetum coccineum]